MRPIPKPFRVLVAMAVIACASCQATVRGSECHQRINDCLTNCPSGTYEPARTPGEPHILERDSRSMCERRCHGLCR